MPTEQNRAGYPSIDKPWLKYYSEEAINAPLPAKSMYQFIYDQNCNHMNDVVMLYMGKKITYRDMFKHIDTLAECFVANGIQKGDVVTIISLNTPETFYCFYALNKIGAIGCMEYVTQPEDLLLKTMKEITPKMVVILNLFVDSFKNALNEYGRRVLVLSPVDSMSGITRLIAKKKLGIKETLSQDIAVNYSKFYNGKKQRCENCDEEDATAALMSTSGSTGVPKKVVLTNRNVNSVAFQYMMSGMNINRGDTFISMAPPFHAFGLALTLHLPLSMGVMTVIATNPSAENCANLFVKHLPNHILGSVEHIVSIAERIENEKIDLRKLYTVAVGGESVSDAVRSKINKLFKIKNSSTSLIVGYGMSELSSTAITEMDTVWKAGSVGIPQTMVNVKIVEEESGKELTYNQMGEIMVSSPGLMKQYINNPEETSIAVDVDENGIRWMHTGDLGYIDEDGVVFIKGRLKRIFWTKDYVTGHVFKLFPDYIEGELEKIPFIKRCAVIALSDKEKINIAVAFISLREKITNAEDKIINELKENIASYDIPSKFVFIDEMPLLSNGKIDYKTLETML